MDRTLDMWTPKLLKVYKYVTANNTHPYNILVIKWHHSYKTILFRLIHRSFKFTHTKFSVLKTSFRALFCVLLTLGLTCGSLSTLYRAWPRGWWRPSGARGTHSHSSGCSRESPATDPSSYKHNFIFQIFFLSKFQSTRTFVVVLIISQNFDNVSYVQIVHICNLLRQCDK